VSTPPEGPAPVSLTVPAPYDDLSSTPCDGTNAVAVSKIQSVDGFVKNVYALAGDTVQLVGLAKACQWALTPDDQSGWGFTADEVDWTVTRGDQATDLGPGNIVQAGRGAVPTTSSLTTTLTAADDNASVAFGNNQQVRSPNGLDRVSTATTVFLHVLDPRLQLTKEVCTLNECQAGSDSGWGAESSATAGSDVLWRLTATNLGNVPLKNVTVSRDDLTGGTASGNGCAGQLVAADLPVGASVSIVCTTSGVEGEDYVVNTAELTSTFVDPSPGERLLTRFPDGVNSGAADARVLSVATPDPAPTSGTPGDGGSGTGGTGGTGGSGGSGSGGGGGSTGSGSGGSGSGSGSGGSGGAVGPSGAPSPGGGVAGTRAANADTASLASTGVDAGPALAAAVALAALGGLVLVLRRRPVRP
jgi:hypothetical protein